MNDFIRKTSILDKISASISFPADNEFDCGYNTAMAEIREWVRNQDDEPIQKGYWKPIMMSEATDWDLSLTGGYDEVCEYVCSCCGESNNIVDEFGEYTLSNFCPNCGADLREETFEEDESEEE